MYTTPKGYTLYIIQRSPPPNMVPTQTLCIIRIIHYDDIHYEKVYCIVYLMIVNEFAIFATSHSFSTANTHFYADNACLIPLEYAAAVIPKASS